MTDRSTLETDRIVEARRMAMQTIEDWGHLSDEERFGALHEIVDQLAKAEAERSADTGSDQPNE